MSRSYSASVDLSVVDAAQDVWELKSASARRVTLQSFNIGKMGTTSERLELEIIRSGSAATSGSLPVTGGGAVTPIAIKSENTDAASTSVEAGNETRISGGSPVTLFNDSFDPAAGYDWVAPSEGEQYTCRNGEYITIAIKSAPAAGNQNCTTRVNFAED